MAREQPIARDRRITAQEDTNLFGGSFTPFRDLWNSLASDLGITTKRMRNDAFARSAEEEAIWQDASSAVTEELGRQRASAENPNDVAQLRVLETQLDAASRMRQSSNPKIQEAGINLLGKITDQQRAFEEQQEAQRIARETQQASIAREMDGESFTRMQGIADDLKTESTDYLKQRDAWGAVNAAVSLPPSAASDLSLIFTFMKVLDPTSVVREGEFATAQNAGGVPSIALTAYNNLLREGQRLTPAQRKDFYDQARSRYLQSSEQQRERNGRYLERARAADVPEKYHGSLMIPVEIPEGTVEFGEDGSAIPRPSTAADHSQEDTNARQIGDSVREGAKVAGGWGLDFLKGIINTDEQDEPEEPAQLQPLPGGGAIDARSMRQRQRRRAAGIIQRPTND